MYPSCVESHFINMPYMDFNLLVITSFAVTTGLLWIHKSPPAVTIAIYLLARFGGTKFDRGWDQLKYGSFMHLRGASQHS